LKRLIYIFLALILIFNKLPAQNNYLILSLKNSPFPGNTPKFIIQDKDNSYWITFWNRIGINLEGAGLARFDGTHWQIYTKDNSPLPANEINAVAIDSLGRKWLATDSGVVKFDGLTWTVYNTRNSPLRENCIWNINIERDTIVWISSCSTGFYRFDGVNWKSYNSTNSPLISDKANFVIVDKDGLKWLGMDYSPLKSFNDTVWQTHGVYPFAPGPGLFYNPTINALAIDKNNFKWIIGPAFWGLGIPRYHAIGKFKDTIWTIFDSTLIGFQYTSDYWGVAIDSNNIKWFTDWRKGLIKYDDTSFYLFNETNSPLRKSSYITVDRYNNKVICAELNEQSSTGEYLNGIVFYNEKGVILSTPKSDFQNKLEFYLSQNYPNPFNPSTKIRFNLPEMNFVTLKVFDILGQEVSTLINGIKEPGEHEVEFNGSKLSGGIYFYQLKVGSYVSTKKMILVK